MKRSSLPSGLLAALLTLAGCSAARPRVEPREPATGPYERLAEELCASAELRVDLSAMRVLVDQVRPRAYSAAAVAHRHVAVVDAELRHGLEYALADRLHLVGFDPFGDRSPASADALELAARHGATHVFKADYDVRGERLDLAARLIEVERQIVVGTARTALAREDLGEAARRALAERPRPHLAEISSVTPAAGPRPPAEQGDGLEGVLPAAGPGLAARDDAPQACAQEVSLAVDVVGPSRAWKAARRRAALRSVRDAGAR